MSLSPDVVVAGRGIVGLSIAAAAAASGSRVTIVGPRVDDATRASAAAGAMLGVLGETVASTDPAAEDDLAARAAARGLYEGWVENIRPSGSDLRIGLGTLVAASARCESDRTHLRAIREAARKLGLPFEDVDPADVAMVSPARRIPVLDAVFLPDEGFVDTELLLDALERHATGLGVEAIDDRVESVTSSARADGVRLAGGEEIAAGAVIVACGADASRLLARSELPGLMPDVFAGKGTSIVLDAGGRRVAGHDVVVRTPNRSFACGVHLVPRTAGRVYLGATNRFATVTGATGAATAGEVHLLLETAIHELDTRLAKCDVVSFTHADRPVAADARPVVGKTELDGLFVATGTYRNGVLLAPLVAAAILAALEGAAGPAGVPRAWAPSGDRSRPPVLAELLAKSAEDVVGMLTEPNGFLPYANDAVLVELLRVALPALADAGSTAAFARRVLSQAPLAECVAELVALIASDGMSSSA